MRDKLKSITKKSGVEKNRTSLKILIVVAHPADIFDQAGGTLLHHIRRGDTVTALALTHGARVHDVVISEEMRQKRIIPPKQKLEKLIKERSDVKGREVIDACAIFGIHDVRFLSYDDSIPTIKDEIIKEIARLIRELRPDIVITHHPYEGGGVAHYHPLAGQLALNAVTVAGGVEPGDDNPPHRVAQVFFMGPTLNMSTYAVLREFRLHCDIFVDISDVIHLKIKALDKMKSQQYEGVYARKITETCDANVGVSVGVAYAESFTSMTTEVHYTLPLSDFMLKKAREPEINCRKRIGFLVTKHKNLLQYKRKFGGLGGLEDGVC